MERKMMLWALCGFLFLGAGSSAFSQDVLYLKAIDWISHSKEVRDLVVRNMYVDSTKIGPVLSISVSDTLMPPTIGVRYDDSCHQITDRLQYARAFFEEQKAIGVRHEFLPILAGRWKDSDSLCLEFCFLYNHTLRAILHRRVMRPFTPSSSATVNTIPVWIPPGHKGDIDYESVSVETVLKFTDDGDVCAHSVGIAWE